MLNKYLKKLGLSSYEDLNKEERETFKSWEEALKGRKLTNKDVAEFLDYELDVAVSRLTEEAISDKQLSFRQAEVKIIKNIIKFLNAPLVEKSYVEKSINQLMQN